MDTMDTNDTKNDTKTIFTFWTGNNQMSDRRVQCLAQLSSVSGCHVELVTAETLHKYILDSAPLHAAYPHLSETHRADYLRTYFMHFHGGGYSDIKETTGSWVAAFDAIADSEDKWIMGYKEVDGGVAYPPVCEYWEELVGNGAYICKPRTPITEEWYNDMMTLLDTKLERVIAFPATFPQDCATDNNCDRYPIGWNEMLGRIFHRICYKYKDRLMNSLPISVFYNYR